MEWISVEKYLPGINFSWLIVRCVNRDLEDFYFMASFGKNGWNFFDDDKGYESSMRVTHWMHPPYIAEPDFFIDKDGREIRIKN